MAITKVGTYRNPPEDITDYEAIVAHLNAYTRQIGNQGMILTEWTNNTTAPKIAMGSYISHGGVLYVSSTETAITAPVADGTYYLKVAASGDTLVLSWIASLTGYAWNAIYNGLYHADESQILGYQLVVSGTVTVFSKRKIVNLANGANGFMTGDYLGNATVGGTLDTGHGANELYPMNQDVRSSASPEFVGLDLSNPVVLSAGVILVKSLGTLTTNSTAYNLVYQHTMNRITGTLRLYHTLTGDRDYGRYYKIKIVLNSTTIYEGTYSSSSSITPYTDIPFISNDILSVYLLTSNSSYSATSVESIKIASIPTNLLHQLALDKEGF